MWNGVKIKKLPQFVKISYRRNIHRKMGAIICMVYTSSQPTFTCSKLTKEPIEQGMKYVRSYANGQFHNWDLFGLEVYFFESIPFLEADS